ncbi:hypothetical protein POF51_29690 [Brevibacillus sp. AG]|uniref:hypothetical protein n=1 Tax=Brevibacillus sp. AG TaxID=3020891 RepID=UPI00232CFC48|nr:hypothetical protein [Brevibacillus sp. AG]MDC0764897.1 hypothetical protein [Brevibacillus sp. AG]
MIELIRALEMLVGTDGVHSNDCECDITREPNKNICRYCKAKDILNKYRNTKHPDLLSITTPIGSIEIKVTESNLDENEYPGCWVEIFSEGLVLVEFDPAVDCHVIRVYSLDQEEPVYVQKVFSTDKEIELLWEELENVTFMEEGGDLYLASNWRMFKSGTSREDVWKWFDKHHSIGVGWLLHDYKWSDNRIG